MPARAQLTKSLQLHHLLLAQQLHLHLLIKQHRGLLGAGTVRIAADVHQLLCALYRQPVARLDKDIAPHRPVALGGGRGGMHA